MHVHESARQKTSPHAVGSIVMARKGLTRVPDNGRSQAPPQKEE